jgi:hypothetical protein
MSVEAHMYKHYGLAHNTEFWAPWPSKPLDSETRMFQQKIMEFTSGFDPNRVYAQLVRK